MVLRVKNRIISLEGKNIICDKEFIAISDYGYIKFENDTKASVAFGAITQGFASNSGIVKLDDYNIKEITTNEELNKMRRLCAADVRRKGDNKGDSM